MEPYIKYLKIFVILLWALVIGGAVYYLSGSNTSCNVNVGGKCYSQANLNTQKFSVSGSPPGAPVNINDPSKLTLPKLKQ